MLTELPRAIKINQQLDDSCAASIQRHVLPSPCPRWNEGLVNLIERGGDHGEEHAEDRPLQPPKVAPVNSPGTAKHATQAVAVGVAQRQKNQRSQDSVADKM